MDQMNLPSFLKNIQKTHDGVVLERAETYRPLLIGPLVQGEIQSEYMQKKVICSQRQEDSTFQRGFRWSESSTRVMPYVSVYRFHTTTNPQVQAPSSLPCIPKQPPTSNHTQIMPLTFTPDHAFLTMSSLISAYFIV